MMTREELIDAVMRIYATRTDLCQCDACKRTFRNFYGRKDDQYLLNIIEGNT